MVFFTTLPSVFRYHKMVLLTAMCFSDNYRVAKNTTLRKLMVFFATLMVSFATLMVSFATLMVFVGTLMVFVATLMVLFATLMVLLATLMVSFATQMARLCYPCVCVSP